MYIEFVILVAVFRGGEMHLQGLGGRIQIRVMCWVPGKYGFASQFHTQEKLVKLSNAIYGLLFLELLGFDW